MVLASHCAPILGRAANFGASPFGLFFQFGHTGVDFFFVLSGFLISLLHWNDIGHRDQLRHYAVRRLTRIYPTYWLVLLAIIPFDIFTHTLFDQYGQPFEIIKSIFLLPQNHRILDVTWSLYNELLFYAFFGLMIFSRSIGATIISIWIIGMAFRPFFPMISDNVWLSLLTYPMNFEFLAGVAAGWAFPRITLRRPVLLLTIGLIGFICLWVAEDQLWLLHLSWGRFVLRCLAYGAAATAVLLGLSTLELQGRVRFPAVLVTLGGASYLLYLIHVPALLILGATERHIHLLRLMPAWLPTIGFVILIIAGTVVLHLRIEKPVLRKLRNKS
jgi:peptidoglycan/LPS O-acetylase OafA/YrhL